LLKRRDDSNVQRTKERQDEGNQLEISAAISLFVVDEAQEKVISIF